MVSKTRRLASPAVPNSRLKALATVAEQSRSLASALADLTAPPYNAGRVEGAQEESAALHRELLRLCDELSALKL